MNRYFFVAMIAVALTPTASGQTNRPTVYVNAEEQFADDFSASVIEKNVPVTLTANALHADYVVRFMRTTNGGSRTMGFITALVIGIYVSGSYERISMSVKERTSNNLVYSYTCQKGGGQVQAANECLAKHWKHAIESGKTKMQEPQAGEVAKIRGAEAETDSIRILGIVCLRK